MNEEAKNSKRSRGSKGKSSKRSGGEKPSGRNPSSGDTPQFTPRDELEHEHDCDDIEVNPPKDPLCERIEPDKWNNIPVCLSKAFRDDVDNQEYLERYIVNVE